VTIQFASPGSAIFSVDVEGQVSPGQLAAAGQYLSLHAWLNLAMPNLLPMIAEAVAERLGFDKPQIAVPGMTPMGVHQILKGMRGD
jgi:hypothetical protein